MAPWLWHQPFLRVAAYQAHVLPDMQKATDEGVDYCRRRVNTLKENIEAIGKVSSKVRIAMPAVFTHLFLLTAIRDDANAAVRTCCTPSNLLTLSQLSVLQIMHERRSVMMRVNQVLQSKMATQNAAQTAAL